MSCPLLLDEMFSDTIAQQLRAKGHDVLAVVADPSLVALPDDQILARAAATGRAQVTANTRTSCRWTPSTGPPGKPTPG